MKSALLRISFLIVSMLVSLTSFAANEDILESKRILLEKKTAVLRKATDRILVNANLAAKYIEVKNNPTEDNLKSLILQFDPRGPGFSGPSLSLVGSVVTEHFFDPGIHGIDPLEGPGTIYLAPELRDFADVYQQKKLQLADKFNTDLENLNSAVQYLKTALQRSIQLNRDRDLSQQQYQSQKSSFCANLPNNVRTVTAKAKWDAYNAVQKKNIWSAELAQRKMTVTSAILTRAQSVCGNSFQSSYAVFSEAAAYVNKTLKSFPRSAIEADICKNLPAGADCKSLLSNQYFLAYVSQVPRSSLRQLHLYDIQKSLPLEAARLVGISQSAITAARGMYWDGPVGVPASGGGMGGSGGGTGRGEGGTGAGGAGRGGAGGGEGSGGGGSGGGGGGGNFGRGQGNGVDHGIDRNNPGRSESPEERARRERAQLAQSVRAELNDNFKQLGDAIDNSGNLSGLASDIQNAVEQAANDKSKIPDFADDLQNAIRLQTGDASGLAGAFLSPQPSSYKSQKAKEFQKIEAKLAGVETPQGNDAREAVKGVLTAADNAQTRGDKENAEFYQSLANVVADIGLSLTPGVSVGKDAYEALTGKSLVTGEELDGFSRGMAIIGVATVGGASGFKTLAKYGVIGGEKILMILVKEEKARKALRGLKELGDIEKAAVKEAIRVFEKYGVKARAIYPGKSGKFIAVGRDMKMVREAKATMKDIAVGIFERGDLSPEMAEKFDTAMRQWDALLKEAKSKGIARIPPDEVRNTGLYKLNKEWIEKAVAEGHTIIDLGNPLNTYSDFYEMELEILKNILSVKL